MIPIDPIKILVLSDQAESSTEFSAMLAPGGFARVVAMNDESRALESLNTSPVDLVIVGATSKDLSSQSVVARLRDKFHSPQLGVPILMAMSEPDKDAIIRAIRSGVDHVIRMPCSVKTLTKTCRGLVRNPPPRITAKDYFGPCRRRLPNASYTGPERRGD